MIDKYSYKVTWSEDDKEFVGLCAEFPSLSWLSKTQSGAFSGIRRLVAEVIQDMKKNKEKLPEALAAKHFSGKFIVRIPPELHRKLAIEAQEAQVSLNRYISARLASTNTN